MRMKTLCLVMSLMLFGQLTLVFGQDQGVISSETDEAEAVSSGFYEHLMLHDYRGFGIPNFELYQESNGTPLRKDPFIAGLLSWFMMGAGQIYAQEYWKGSLFIAASLTNKVLLVLLLSHINSKYGSSGQIVSVDWNSFEAGTKVLIITYIAEALGLRIFSVVDAVQSAKKYNDRYSPGGHQGGFSIDIEEDDVSLGYNYRFSN
jgi:TM2 domain-containing membrane protein YozV